MSVVKKSSQFKLDAIASACTDEAGPSPWLPALRGRRAAARACGVGSGAGVCGPGRGPGEAGEQRADALAHKALLLCGEHAVGAREQRARERLHAGGLAGLRPRGGPLVALEAPVTLPLLSRSVVRRRRRAAGRRAAARAAPGGLSRPRLKSRRDVSD